MIRTLFAIAGPTGARRFRIFVALCIANGVTQGLALALLVPVVRALVDGRANAAWAWFVVLVVAALVNASVAVLSNRRAFDAAMDVVAAMHRRLGAHLVRLPMGWFDSRAPGRLSHVAVRGTMFVARSSMDVVGPFLLSITTPATLAIVTLVLDWRLGLALIACMPVLWVTATLAGHAHDHATRLTHTAGLETDRRLLEFAGSQVALRSAGLVGTAWRPLDEAIEGQRRAGLRSTWASVVGSVTQGIVVQALFGAVVALAVHLALTGAGDPAGTIAVIGLVALVAAPLRTVTEFAAALQRARGELADVADVLETPGLPRPEHPARGVDQSVELRGVRFGYDPRRPVLDGFDLRVEPRTLTALVGPSGSGKTTVTRLVARFFDVDAGAVLVGGVDVREQDPDELLASVSLIFQDVYLLDDTLRANVLLGRPDASEEDVARAVRLARVDEIAERLPDGWQARVGEGGHLLSGGERQRVSVARALLKDAPFVLVDEATAALDATTEMAVADAVTELARTATVLVIAHQLSTVVVADSIAVLDDGRVVEHGTHTDLLARDGRWAALWRARETSVTTHPPKENA